MKFLRRSAYVFLAVCMVWFGIMPAAQAMPRDDQAREYLERAQQKMARLNSVRADIAFDLKTQLMDVSVVTTLELLNQPPIQGKIEIEGCVRNSITPPYTFSAPSYYAEEEDQFIIYQQLNGVWKKQVEKKPKVLNQRLLSHDDFMTYVKKINFKQQTEELVVLDVTFDMEKLCVGLKEYLVLLKEQTAMKSQMESADIETFIWPALRAAGDFSVTLTIDRKTDHIVNLYADLSAQSYQAAMVMIEKASLNAKQKASYKNLLSGLQMVIQEDFSDFDAVAVEIPRDIKEAPLFVPEQKKSQDVQ